MCNALKLVSWWTATDIADVYIAVPALSFFPDVYNYGIE